jgi:hypothetical protein
LALRNLGHHTEGIFAASWRATRESVLGLAEQIHDKMQEVRVDAVILCVLDNNIYYGLTDTGETCLPKKDKDGNYHIEGDLIVCSKSAQHTLFKVLTPIFDAACSKPCILMSPMPRYLHESCCNQEEHMPNRRGRIFGQHLLDNLKEATANLRDFCFTSTFKAMKVLDPQVSWRGTSLDEVWGADPVHPTAAGYGKLAAGVEAICLSIESGAKKRARSNSFETGDGPSSSHTRQRSFDSGSRGPHRGAGTVGRGGRGGRGRN